MSAHSEKAWRRAEAHKARGDDAWHVIAKLYDRIMHAEESVEQCVWFEGNLEGQPRRCPMRPNLDALDTTASIAWHLPLCDEHVAMFRLGFVNLERTPQKDDQAWVYYLRRRDGFIKIGRTISPGSRKKALEIGSGPLELLAVEKGSYSLEAQRHSEFWRDRAEGEWFRPSDALLEHVRWVRKTGDVLELVPPAISAMLDNMTSDGVTCD
jgi:hypothetical protein